jgi:hypothetical protein
LSGVSANIAVAIFRANMLVGFVFSYKSTIIKLQGLLFLKNKKMGGGGARPNMLCPGHANALEWTCPKELHQPQRNYMAVTICE